MGQGKKSRAMGCFVRACAGLNIGLEDAGGGEWKGIIPGSQPLGDFLELFFRCVKIVLNSFVNHYPLSLFHTRYLTHLQQLEALVCCSEPVHLRLMTEEELVDLFEDIENGTLHPLVK